MTTLPSPVRQRFSWSAVVFSMILVLVAAGAFFVFRQLGEGGSAGAAAGQAEVGAVAHVDIVFHVMATLSAVIALGYVLGRVFRYLGQPPVIGEVLAGIALGPSLLGFVSPELMYLLVPSAADDPHGQVPAALKAVAHLGVILYMFLVGLELNGSKLQNIAGAILLISVASITFPFTLGTGLSLWLHPLLAEKGVPFTSFALFLGVAMSITAFPVLARILTDRGMEKSDLGILALSCAAVNDVIAWCLLSLVVGVAQAQISGALFVGIGAIAYIAVMILVVRPILGRVAQALDQRSRLPHFAVMGVYLLILLSATVTEMIGIHAIIGAFVMGAIVPHDSKIAQEFTRQLREPVLVLLLPAFFAVTGMRTQIGLLDDVQSWLVCGAIILVATFGTFIGSLAAARWSGYDTRTAASLGVLMNTRGMMELIVLSVGLELGVISPTLFAMLVLMAIATTMATSPLLAMVAPRRGEYSSHPADSLKGHSRANG